MRRITKLTSTTGIALALGLGGLAGCSGGGGSGRGSGSVAAPVTSATPGGTTPAATAPVASVKPALRAPAGTWLKGDFHVHTEHSGDATTLGDDIASVIHCAERAGLDFTTISDHRATPCLTDPQFTGTPTSLILIAGEEWGGPGHAGAHGLTRPPIYDTQDESQGAAVAVAKIQQTIDDIHGMGGIFLLNHPMDDKTPWLWPVDRFDGMEIWNQSWALRSSADMTPAMVAKWMTDHGMAAGGVVPPRETDAALQAKGGGTNLQRLKLYEAHLASGRHFAAVGGGDSHYLFLPGLPTTLVFAEKATKDGVLDGVRHARTQVLRSPGAPTLEFTADRDGDGIFESILGDSIPIGQGPVTFKIHVKGAQDGKLDLVRNGVVVQHTTIGSQDFEVTFTDAPAARSWYRVDCWEKLDLSFPHADTLRQLVLGSQSYTWLNALTTSTLLGGKIGSLAQNAVKLLDSGGPAAIWLLVEGHKVGMKVSPVPTRYPRLELPDPVLKVLNVAVHDPDYCPSVLTSPIWIE